MNSFLKRYYMQQLSRPGLVGLFVNPFYFARRGLLLAVGELACAVRGRVLDVGCGSRPYESLFKVSEYVGLELDTPENRAKNMADIFYDGGTFPFEAASFDTIVCNEVLEHVFNPDEFMQEIVRVLNNEGQLLLTVPFVWDEHEQPRDYARYSSYGLAALLGRNGLEIVEHRKTNADLRVVFQMINAYLFKKTETRNAYANLFITLVLMAPFNIVGTILGWLMPGNPDLYLDNVVLARKASKE